jgi:hypothetical protein
MLLLAHITEADGPGIVSVLLIGIGAGVVLGLAVAGLRVRRRR